MMPDEVQTRRRSDTAPASTTDSSRSRPSTSATLDSVNALVSAMANTAFGGRRLGEAADVLEAMVRDENCFRVVTISGAMTIAKQGLVLCEMIDRGWVQASSRRAR